MSPRLRNLILLFTILNTMTADLAFPHLIPFAFRRAGVPVLNWDFTALTTLPSELTLTRASTATYTDVAGVVQTAGTNTARFDYDLTTHAAQGILLEPAATNLLPGSADMNLTAATYWSAGGSPMTSTNNTIVAPDGTTTAERFSAPSGISYAIPTVNPTTTNGSTYTFSIYAKSTSSGNARIALQEDGGSYTIYQQVVISVTTSWKRFSVTATRASANPMRTVITMDRGGGDLATMDVWGAQLELGSYATSYIPTTTTTVTRSADSLAFNTMAWYNSAQGVLNAEYVNLGSENSVIYRIFGLFNTNVAGTFANNSIELSDQGTSVTTYVSNGGTVQASASGTVNGVGVVNTQTVSYKNAFFLYSLNHGTIASASSGSIPTANYAYIGSQPDGNIRRRYIRKIKYYNVNLPNASIQGM